MIPIYRENAKADFRETIRHTGTFSSAKSTKFPPNPPCAIHNVAGWPRDEISYMMNLKSCSKLRAMCSRMHTIPILEFFWFVRCLPTPNAF
jgi:hypothetical protein